MKSHFIERLIKRTFDNKSAKNILINPAITPEMLPDLFHISEQLKQLQPEQQQQQFKLPSSVQSDNTNDVPLSQTKINSQKVDDLFESKGTTKRDNTPAVEKMTQMINPASSSNNGPRGEESLSSPLSISSSSQLRSTPQRIPLQNNNNKNSQKTSFNAGTDETKDVVDGQSKATHDSLIEQSKQLLPSSNSSRPSYLSSSFPSSATDYIKGEAQGSKRETLLDTLDSKEKIRKIHPLPHTSPSKEVHLQTSTREEGPRIDITQPENPLEHSKLHKAISSNRPEQREQTAVNMLPDSSITHLKQNPKIIRNDSERSVTINIGRIDVSAIISSPSAIKKLYNNYSSQQQAPHNVPPAPASPPLSLKDYLKQRASKMRS